jgi:hypothetical protein
MNSERLYCRPHFISLLVQVTLASLVGSPMIASGVAVRYASYLGGSYDEGAAGIAVDVAGNAYVVGTTQSPDFPITTGRPLQGGQDAYVAKFSPEGALLYCTFVGGPCEDEGRAIAVDAVGNAYITGRVGLCFSQGGLDPGVLVAKLNPAGELVYLFTFGNSLADSSTGYGIAVDVDGSAYVTGSAQGSSSDFPTTPGAFRSTPCGGFLGDGFIAKLSPAGDTLVYCTYICGTAWDAPVTVAVDAAGNAHVGGVTASEDFPTVNAFQAANPGGSLGEAGFLCKLDPTGSKLIYSTYMGGPLGDSGISALTLDGPGNVYVTGVTSGGDFPTTPGVVQPTALFPLCFSGLCSDAFVTKFSPDGALIYSTYLGGEGDDSGSGIALDPEGNVLVAGSSASLYFPIRNACQADNRGLNDIFVTKLNPDASRILSSTYLGGGKLPNSSAISEGSDDLYGMALGANGDIYLTGYTSSLNFPTTEGVFQPKARGGDCFVSLATCGDAFVARVTPDGPGTTPALRVEVSPEEVTAGATFTATWTGIPNPSPNDQLELFPLGESSDATQLQANYATTGTAAGTLKLPLSRKLVPGAYEIRLMTTDPQFPPLLRCVARSAPLILLDNAAARAHLILSRDPGNALRFQIDGSASQTYTLEATDMLNPAQWRVLGAMKPGTGGVLEFTDKVDLTVSRRFYRASKP